MVRRASTKGHDLPIEGAADPRMTVLGLVEEMRAVRMADEDHYRQAEIRERIVLGDMMPGAVGISPEQVTASPDLREPMHENVIMPALQTLVARIDQGRIDAKCWPHTPTPARIAGAEGGNLILDAERQRQRRDMKVHESIFWALVHGDSGLYSLWDDAYGPIEAIEPVLKNGVQAFDEQGFPLQQIVEEWGGMRVEVLSTFDFWTSGEDNSEDMRWQVRRRIVDKWTAQAALYKADILRDVAEVDHPTRVIGRRKRGVEVLEIWVKPGAMIGPGLHAVVVDGQAVKSVPYPLPHKRLPISIVTCMRVFDTPHGHTVTKDGVSQQRLVDVSLRSITRRADIAGDARLIGVDALIDGIDSEREGRIKIDGSSVLPSEAGFWLTGAEIPKGLVEVYALAKAALQDVMGVSAESVTGGDPSSTTSGEQLKTASALDAQKIVPIRRRCEVAWEEVDRQTIELWRAKASKPRLASVVGDPVRAMYLQGADLDGVDVAIESSSGLALSHAGKSRQAEEQMAAGQIDPITGAQRAATGTVETVIDGETKQRLEQQAVQAIRNVPQMPLPGVDGAAAGRFLRLIVARAPAGRTAALLQLIAMYEQTMAPPMGMPAAQGAPKATPSSAPLEPTASPEVMQ